MEAYELPDHLDVAPALRSSGDNINSEKRPVNDCSNPEDSYDSNSKEKRSRNFADKVELNKSIPNRRHSSKAIRKLEKGEYKKELLAKGCTKSMAKRKAKPSACTLADLVKHEDTCSD